MIAQAPRTSPIMDKERTTRAEPVKVDALQKARDQLQTAVDNLTEVIEKMERAKLDTLTLRWKTRRESAGDWFLFSKGLDQTFEGELMKASAEASGEEAKNKARKSRDK